jgi:hypothetical protein
MKKYHAEEDHAEIVRKTLASYEGLEHLRVRRRADLVVIESGATQDPIAHARFRRVTVHLWRLEMATHTGQWQPTPLRDQLERLVEMLIQDFAWTLARIE